MIRVPDGFGAVVGAALFLVAAVVECPVNAQAPPASAGPVDQAVIDDLVAASRILADQGVVDGYGHVSIRHPKDAKRYLMARSLAPALVTADDIMEFDLDSIPVDRRGRAMFLERFIHGEIYKVRPDVNAVVHTHSPGVIPFSITTQVPLKPVAHIAPFLYGGVPIFEIRGAGPGASEMLVANGDLGKALAATLADKPVALMRGHGDVVVGPDVQTAVRRAIYTDVNARLQVIAIQIGGPISYLSAEEGAAMEAVNPLGYARIWDLWKRKAMAAQ